MKIYGCKICDFEGIRKEVRKHIRNNHLWKGSKLNGQIKSREFK